MEIQESYIELYPGNWLCNASVLGFLLSLQRIEGKNIKDYMLQDGRFVISPNIFDELKVQERYFEKDTQISSIVAKAPIYRNYLQSSEKELYQHFVKSLKGILGNQQCDILTTGYNIPEDDISNLKTLGLSKFIERIPDFNMVFHAALGPSLSAFPNAYWNYRSSNKVCHLFAFLVIHQHLAFTELLDKTKVFINAPSFRVMYELNNVLSELEGKEKASYRNLLAMSVVEFSIRTNVILHTWAGMDIEIVAVKNGKIEFINLPYDTIRLLSNKRIAELISSISDFRILNMVIEHEWNDLVELGYRLLKIAMSGIGKEDKNFIGQFYTPDNYRTESSIKILANKLLKLYSLIEERTKHNDNDYINR